MGLKELIERYAYCKPTMAGWYRFMVDERIIFTNGRKATAEEINRCENGIAGIDIHVRQRKIERVDIITKS